MIALWWSLAWAGAPDAALVKQRLDEVAPLRAQRLTTDAPTISGQMYQDALEGDIPTRLESVPGHAAKKAVGVGIFPVPIGQLWAAVNNESSKVENTRLGYLEILEGKDCETGRRVLQYLPVSLVSDRWWVVEQTANSALMGQTDNRVREVQWKSVEPRNVTETAQRWMDKGIAVAYTHGSWLLIDLNGTHTLVEYYAWTDPGGSIPAGLASSFAGGAISDTLATTAQLGAKGTSCPVF